MALDEIVHQFGNQVEAITVYSSAGSPPFFHQTAYDKIQNYPNASGTPLLWVDGNLVGWQYYNWEDSVSLQLSEPSDLTILIEGNFIEATNSLNLNLRVINESDKGIIGRLHIVLTEDSINWSAMNGQEIHNKVPRIWWPNDIGEKLNIAASGDVEQTIHMALSEEWNINNLKVVAYVQDENLINETTIPIFQGASLRVTDIVTSISENNSFVNNFTLNQNYPNPFNPSTIISYQLTTNSKVELSIFNTLGQKVTELVSGNQPAGTYEISWNASRFTSGIYYYRLKVGNNAVQKKMLLIR